MAKKSTSEKMKSVFHYEDTEIPNAEEIQRQVDQELAREGKETLLKPRKKKVEKEPVEVESVPEQKQLQRVPEYSARLFEPVQYADGEPIAQALISGQSAYISLEQLDNQHASRLIDFLTGVVYGINGDIARVGATMFLCTPNGIEMTEDMKSRFTNE